MKMNVVPFKAPETFERFGIDWTKDAKTEAERELREADLQAAADFAEVMLAVQLRKHVDDVMLAARSLLESGGPLWS